MTRDWRYDAACRRHPDPELFFPIGTAGPAVRQADKAKQVCRSCEVAGTCLDFAVETGQAGVWGGMSEDERRAYGRSLRRQRLRVVAG